MSRPEVHGILNLYKPPEGTSMDMVRLVKRLTRVKRVGHAGTLDPIAEGVLPVCMGQATRLMEYLVEGSKVYRARFRLGVATETQDSTGTTVSEADPSGVTRDQIGQTLESFTGTIHQQPPMYSALKWEGKRLYDLARAGLEVDRPLREVQVYRLALLAWEPPTLTVEAECGRGLYMRTLAHDVGAALGCGAHLSGLTRLRAGTLRAEDTVSVQQLQEAAEGNRLMELVLPPDVALLNLDGVLVEPPAERHLRHGQAVSLRAPHPYTPHLEKRRAYAADGRFLGVVRFDRAQALWQPEKLFSLSTPSPYAPVRALEHTDSSPAAELR